MSRYILIVTILSILLEAFDCQAPTNSECSIIIRKLEDKQPLILYENINNGFVAPNNDNRDGILMRTGEKIRLACPATHFAAMNDTNIGIFQCVRDNIFLFNDEQHYSLHHFMCDDYPIAELREYGTKCGNGMADTIHIGFKIDQANQEFYPLYDICYNKVSDHTYYAHTLLKGGVKMLKKSSIDSKTANFYGNNIGSNTNRTNYVAKGQLIGQRHFFYRPVKRTALTNVNSVPIWQSVKIGNWAIVETTIQNYVEKSTFDYEIFAGGKEISQGVVIDSRLKDVDFHYIDDAGRTISMKVPSLLYKILYNAKRKSGIVFIVVNNPYFVQVPTTFYYVICNDVSSQLTADIWKEFVTNRADLSRGYAYACDVNEFKNLYPPNYFPSQLDVQYLLDT